MKILKKKKKYIAQTVRLQKKKEGEETVTNESLSLSRISREIPLNETVDDFQRLLQRSSSVRITFYQSPGWQLGADCAFNAMNAIVVTFSPPFLLPSPRALVSWNSNFAPRTEETAISRRRIKSCAEQWILSAPTHPLRSIEKLEIGPKLGRNALRRVCIAGNESRTRFRYAERSRCARD